MNSSVSALHRTEVSFLQLERLARESLREELCCYPKPGLVSLVDHGSHADMSADTFLRSIDALSGYFSAMAEAGARKAPFSELNVLGRKAEARMFRMTQGRNTHRGAIFTLGLLAAGAGFAAGRGELRAEAVCRAVPELWAAEIVAAGRGPQAPSHGSAVRQHFGVTGAREEAAAGFPTILGVGLEALREARRAGADRNDCGLQALFAIMAILPDNNLLYRGGAEGLAFAQHTAKSFLAAGGMLASGGQARALSLHRRFVEANLSPGGAADLLAATLFIDALELYGEQL